MNKTGRITCLLLSAALGWWSAVGLDYVADQAIKKETGTEHQSWTVEMKSISSDHSSSPG